MCTQTFLHSVQEMLRANNEELTNVRERIVYERNHERFIKSEHETQELYSNRMRWQENSRIDLELRLNQLGRTINRHLAEVSDAQFGINYQRSHPYDEFVIFIREDGNILQRTNAVSYTHLTLPTIYSV